MRNAFTLIELLIVVAIIGILAAIAVPNFLQARSKSMIARVQADMKNIATAIEAYNVDWNGLPVPIDHAGRRLTESSPTEFWSQTRLSYSLTTPVSYMSSIPNDPFHAHGEEDEVLYYHYITRPYTKLNAGDEEPFNFFTRLYIPSAENVNYILLGHGPDDDHDGPKPSVEVTVPVLYNATNGAVSNGDIMYFGPGGGFGQN